MLYYIDNKRVSKRDFDARLESLITFDSEDEYESIIHQISNGKAPEEVKEILSVKYSKKKYNNARRLDDGRIIVR